MYGAVHHNYRSWVLHSPHVPTSGIEDPSILRIFRLQDSQLYRDLGPMIPLLSAPHGRVLNWTIARSLTHYPLKVNEASSAGWIDSSSLLVLYLVQNTHSTHDFDSNSDSDSASIGQISLK